MILLSQTIPINAQKASRPINFGWIEWLIISGYLLIVFGVNFFFWYQRKRQKDDLTRTYFTCDDKVPSWVVGFSVWATILSIITYLATPANAYQFGWVYSFAQITMIILVPFILKKIIPFFRLMKQNSVYSYLEVRYSKAVRLITSSLFIFFNIFRVGIILYITTLALSFIIPIRVEILMLLMGLFVIATTLIGGFKAILWSDAIQGIIRIGLIIIIIIYCLVNIDFKNYQPAAFLKASNFNLSLVQVGIPIVFLGNIIISLYSYVCSQDVVRRYKQIANPKKIAKSIWFVAFLSLISILFFYGLGSALYSFYGGTKITEILKPVTHQPRSNQIIPYFGFAVLPVGLGALLIGSIFTATQSNISSGLTVIANSIFSEFIALKKQKSLKKEILIIRIIIIIFGIFSILLGIGLLYLDIDDIIVYFLGIMGLFGSAPVAIFMLAIFTERTSAKAALIGLIGGLILALGLWFISQKIFLKEELINSLWISIFSFCLTTILGYGLSFIWPNKKDITNLSWRTINADFKTFLKLKKNYLIPKN